MRKLEGRTSDPKSLEKVLSNLKRYKCKRVVGPCAFCHATPRTLKRGLCSTCYMTPEIREEYAAPLDIHIGVGIGGTCKKLGEPTCERPGSEAKIVVLEKRAELRQVLFHPLDWDPRTEFDPEIGMLIRFLKVLPTCQDSHAEV